MALQHLHMVFTEGESKRMRILSWCEVFVGYIFV